MLISKRKIAVLTLSGLGLAFTNAVQAQSPSADDVGKVVFVFGSANLTRGGSVPLTKGLGLKPEDKVTTGSNGRAQLRMVDNSKIALRPGTEFLVKQVSNSQPASDGSVIGDKRQDKAVFQLLKGGLRTLTGEVGGKQEGEYQLITPVATIGIRGTAYSVALADPSECVKSGGSPGKSRVALYVTVSDGEIYVENDAGRLNLDPSEFGCVTGINSAPVLLLRPPNALTAEAKALGGEESDDEESSSQKRSSDSSRAASNGSVNTNRTVITQSEKSGESKTFTATSTRTRPPGATTDFNNRNQVVSTNPPTEFSEPTTEVTADDGNAILTDGGGEEVIRSITVALPLSLNSDSVFAQRSGGIEVDNSGNLTKVEASDGHVYGIGSSSNVNTGQEANSGVRWGRWAGGSAELTAPGGSAPNSVDLSNSSLHWVVGTAGSGNVVIPTTGTRSFTVVGNTSPTDGNGNIGTFGNASLSADFTASSVQTDVNFSLNGEVWTGSNGAGAISGSTFSGNYGVVTAGPAGNNLRQGNGEFSGFFTNNADAAGLSYGLEVDNPAGTAIDRASGVVVFTGN